MATLLGGARHNYTLTSHQSNTLIKQSNTMHKITLERKFNTSS